jgi:AcrR family transcriptional regulator
MFAIERTCATLSDMPVQENELGRRERKSQRTRRQIIRAAAELVLENGYERATIARIADRADLATRTVTTRFPTKEAIFFEGIEHALDRVELRLGAPDGDVVDRLRAWIGEMSALAETDPEDPELRALRSRAIAHDPELRALFAQQFNRAHRAVAEAVAADTGESPEDAGPQMIAAATIAMLRAVERVAAEHGDVGKGQLERGFAVLRAALSALSR